MNFRLNTEQNKWKSWREIHLSVMTLQSSFCLAIAQVYNNEGTEAFLKEDYSNAVYFYTEGIKVNCKDEDCMAVLYGNRASANFKEGQLMCFCFFVFCVFFSQILGSLDGQRVVSTSDLQSSRVTGFAFRSAQFRGNEFNSPLVNSQVKLPHSGWRFLKLRDKFGWFL